MSPAGRTGLVSVYVPETVRSLIDLYRAHGHEINFSRLSQLAAMDRLIEIEDSLKVAERAPISSRASLLQIKNDILDRKGR